MRQDCHGLSDFVERHRGTDRSFDVILAPILRDELCDGVIRRQIRVPALSDREADHPPLNGCTPSPGSNLRQDYGRAHPEKSHSDDEENDFHSGDCAAATLAEQAILKWPGCTEISLRT